MTQSEDEQEYFGANQANWDDRARIHAVSRRYSLGAFQDPTYMDGVVSFDKRYLGDLSGQSAVHLQSHIGTDTISLARLGADVTGLDQSAESLAVARKLFADTNTEGLFVQANVYDAPAALGRTFDLVYTGVGALNWLPSVDRWAKVVSELLAPGGRLYLREGHPMLWAMDDDREDGVLSLRFPYFETADPMVFDFDTTYTDGDATVTHTRTYEWNHGIGEIITAVLDHGLVLDTFHEHRELEWKGLPQMVDADGGRFKMPEDQVCALPLMYTLIASKPAGVVC